MENKSSVFTKKGDSGNTKLYNGNSVPKDNAFIETNGQFDELTSHVGLIKSKSSDPVIREQLERIQQNLMALMGMIAGFKPTVGIEAKDVEQLEQWILTYEKKYPKKNAFVLPGSNELSALIDVTRAICRRCERQFVKWNRLGRTQDYLLQYVNRLSDYFYVLARYTDFITLIESKVVEAMGTMQVENKRVETVEVKNRVDETYKSITLAGAKSIIQEVETKAMEMGINVVIAIANNHGNPVAVHVMDDAYIASYDIALNKAFTSASLKMTTKKLSELAEPGASLYGIQHTNEGKIVIFGGGTPLLAHGNIVGALGVSGGSTEEDSYLADYGARVAKEVL